MDIDRRSYDEVQAVTLDRKSSYKELGLELFPGPLFIATIDRALLSVLRAFCGLCQVFKKTAGDAEAQDY